MYKNLREAVNDLDKSKQLIRISSKVSGELEAAEIHRRIFENKGPAILFEHIMDSPFQAVSNLYGTIDRTDFLFRQTMDRVKRLIEVKADPTNILKRPFRYTRTPITALEALPMKARLQKPILFGRTTISKLPLIKSWPMDGGAFVTLPQVLTMPPNSKNIMESNIGMYRIQLNGNEYKKDEEIGLHYQIHRGIGVHHTLYNESEDAFKCSIFIGGPPSHAFAAIMPMPENISELTFAGMLAGRRFRYFYDAQGFVVSADADFVITGVIEKGKKLPEGPFGDHLGYYSLKHDFPFMKVKNVYHKKDPLWQFTVVGRPPQEDSSFGYLIHKLVEELTPGEFPGLVNINAVDAAGVHPLLLAVAKDRYMPFREAVPEEILTVANRILGSGQTSLAKYLFIAAHDDNPSLDSNNIKHYFSHLLERVRWERDLHFQTQTTIDTLDYSGSGWNAGSKLVIACRGNKIRALGQEIPQLPSMASVHKASVPIPGVIAFEMDKWTDYGSAKLELESLTTVLDSADLNDFPLIVICDDARFIAETLNNFLWVAFTRSNPSHDVYGVRSFTTFKHWGCKGSLIIDARIKTFHAPELVPDAQTVKKVDELFSKGGELYGNV